jgi:predicted Rossmann-fold nucleotide-binding protein
MARIPIILMGRDFWDEVVNWKAFAKYGLIKESDLELIDFVETAQEAWSVVEQFYKEESWSSLHHN